MIELRGYQKEAIDCLITSLSEENAALCVAPTGSGKTEIMMGFMRELLSLNSSLSFTVIIKRIKLVEQTDSRFREYGLPSRVFCSTIGRKEIGQITVASVDSIHSIQHRSDYVILDEAHNLNIDQENSRYFKTIDALKNSGSKFVGFTATPYRSNGYIYGDEKLFPKISYSIELKELIEKGFLVKPICKSTKEEFDTSKLKTKFDDWDEATLNEASRDEDKLSAQVKEALSKIKDRKKIFWQAINIQHADNIAREILVQSGEKAAVVHYKTEDSALLEFEEGDVRHCVFIFQLSEGYNYKPADALIMLRPTRSPVLYVQTVGRVLRTSPETGKKDALILDFGQIVKHCGPIDNPTINEFGKKGNKKSLESEKALVWACKHCLTYNNLESESCADCGAPRAEQKEIDKNTTTDSYEGDFLSSSWGMNKFFRVNIERANAEPYISKKGNRCIRINYFEKSNNLLFSPNGSSVISEYYSLTSEYAIMLLRKRAMDLKIDNPELLTTKTFAKRIPSELIYNIENGYKKIKALSYED